MSTTMPEPRPVLDAVDRAILGNPDPLAPLREVIAARWPAVRRRFPRHRGPCADCAFRRGTEASLDPQVWKDLERCFRESIPFHCHHGMRGDQPSRLCVGWSVVVAETTGVPT